MKQLIVICMVCGSEMHPHSLAVPSDDGDDTIYIDGWWCDHCNDFYYGDEIKPPRYGGKNARQAEKDIDHL